MINTIPSPASYGKDFYPTPPDLIDKMLSGVDLYHIRTVLEPSAGKGDMVERILEKDYNPRGDCVFKHIRCVDCVEINPELRTIIKYNFGSGRAAEALRVLEQFRDKERQTEAEERIYAQNTRTQRIAKSGIVHVVYDDFLRYNPYKKYDLILMNPPFSDGCAHLLKAIEIQKSGGSIVCLLNAETLRNPCTDQRKHLVKLLKEYGAEVEYLSGAFADAERKTDVEIALVKVFIPKEEIQSDFWERMKKEEQFDDTFAEDATEIEVSDYIKAAVSHFNVEIKAGLELIRQYRAMKPYMACSFDKEDPYSSEPILRLTDSNDRGYDDVSVNSYAEKTRLKYWRLLLSNPKFIGKLTSTLQKEYREKVERLKEYDFNEFNIQALSVEMMAEVKGGIEREIEAMFDRLSSSHSWYGETSQNRHYYNGWATNKAWKINKKVILPRYGVFGSWDGRPDVYQATNVLSDIERIFNYFSGNMTEEVTLHDRLEKAFKAGQTRNISCRFFDVTFYKKGTVGFF